MKGAAVQQMRQGPGGQWLCMADRCDAAATHGWARSSGDGNTTAVTACDPHKISDLQAAHLHLPACPAPPTCTCGGECPPECPCKEPLPPGYEAWLAGEDT